MPPPLLALIDDQESYLRTFKAHVKRSNKFSLLTCDQPDEVLDWVDRKIVSAVISDWKGDYFDGVELLESIRLKDKDIDLVLITAFKSNHSIRKRCNAINAKIISKYPSIDNIINNVTKLPCFLISNSIESDSNELILEEKQLSNDRELIVGLSKELLNYLEATKNKNDYIYSGDRKMTVFQLIEEIKKLSDIGKKYILLYYQTKITLNLENRKK